MKELEKISKELAGGDRGEALRRLGSTPEGRKLEGMIDGEALREALRGGDGAALKRMLGELLSTPEGRKLADDVGKIMGK